MMAAFAPEERTELSPGMRELLATDCLGKVAELNGRKPTAMRGGRLDRSAITAPSQLAGHAFSRRCW